MLDEVRTPADGDEEVALLDAPRVDLQPRHRVGPRPGDEPPEGLEDAELDGDHASSSRATSLSENGIERPSSSISVSAPLPAMTTTSPGFASASAAAIAS